MTNQMKMENGELIEMTDDEQADYDARQAAWPPIQADAIAQAALPDLATQVAHLTAFVVDGTALPAEMLTAANAKLESIGQPAIGTLQAVKLG